MNEKNMKIQGEINAMQQLLKNTDYKALKYAEGALTESEFADTKAKRAEWRARINELETQMED